MRELSLAEIEQRAWELLAGAPGSRESALRVGTLASVAGDGGPRARSVVLRGAGRGWVEVYTDLRSPKVEELRREPRAALCLYDPELQLQLRLEGRVTVHAGDARSASAWREAGIYARRDYLGPKAPGTPLADPREGDPQDGAVPSAEEGAHNLAVLRLEATRLDWLVLSREGHRRAELVREGPDPSWRARWLLP